MSDFVMLSLMPMVVGTAAALACALVGNFLVLRRQSLIGDAVSHVVLPGIVAAFLLTGVVAPIPMLAGATVAAIVAAGLIALVRRAGGVEPGAAMGVVFTSLFAAGVLLLETSGARSVHLDVEHALLGNLESLIWFEGLGWSALLDPSALAAVPPQVWRLIVVLAIVSAFVVLFWKELVLGSFDPVFAATVGARPALFDAALMLLTAVVAVFAFEAVGSILVVAMFVCPPAAARLMTDRLVPQVMWSLAFAVLSAVGGYVLAGYGPLWLGYQSSVSAAGMIAVVSGLILAAACVAGPRRKGTRSIGAPA
ncbi:metal ABC transporter permease [Chthonobacter rhizosphaerae]|uniref:metal ABC transporter permease n=1 Tax=Chthonobacter rhizosphaerae TaxID=2735553 RepID=UPI0015EEEA03|nr:metal ABC transporter permease [Chthonobacter rhizosphaerae]